MTRNAEDIEREVETARSDLDRTVDALKDKMTPGQLIDELAGSFRGGAASEMLGNLGAQARENPMALAMIGAGMAWLMNSRGSITAGTGSGPLGTMAGGSVSPGSGHGGLTELAAATGAAGHQLGAKVADAAGELKSAIGGAAEGASDSLHALGDRAAAGGRKMSQSFDNILQQEPLIVGAFGLAIGVAIGAALPATPLEDRTFGAVRDDLLDAGKETLSAAAHDVRASGDAAYRAVREEADRQGFTGGDETLVEKADAVVRSGVEAAKDQWNSRPS